MENNERSGKGYKFMSFCENSNDHKKQKRGKTKKKDSHRNEILYDSIYYLLVTIHLLFFLSGLSLSRPIGQ